MIVSQNLLLFRSEKRNTFIEGNQMREHLVLFNLDLAFLRRQFVIDFYNLLAYLPKLSLGKSDLVFYFLSLTQSRGKVLQFEKHPRDIAQNQTQYSPGYHKKNQKVQ